MTFKQYFDKKLLAESTDADSEYLTAVEQGNMDAAQALVKQAAHNAGYIIGPVIHRTHAEFTEFSKEAPAVHRKSDQQAFYFSDPDRPSGYKGKPKRFYIRGELADITGAIRYGLSKGRQYNAIKNDAMNKARAAGKLGTVFRGNGANAPEFSIFEPNHIKSALTVTRDSAGNIIPLSQRFNPNNPSILH